MHVINNNFVFLLHDEAEFNIFDIFIFYRNTIEILKNKIRSYIILRMTIF